MINDGLKIGHTIMWAFTAVEINDFVPRIECYGAA
jgi:hypothetical protein